MATDAGEGPANAAWGENPVEVDVGGSGVMLTATGEGVGRGRNRATAARAGAGVGCRRTGVALGGKVVEEPSPSNWRTRPVGAAESVTMVDLTLEEDGDWQKVARRKRLATTVRPSAATTAAPKLGLCLANENSFGGPPPGPIARRT